MTKHRLMLSAAAAALLASPWFGAAVRADTEVSKATTTALATSTAGNIVIDTTGSIAIKAASPIITINSNSSYLNQGALANTDTASALGLEIDSSGGNLVFPTILTNRGTISLGGTGSGKTAVLISGANTIFGSIDFLSSFNSTTDTVTGSSIAVQGDGSNAIALVQFTTIDGDIDLGGPISMIPSDKSNSTGSTLVELEGNINGNLIIDNTAVLSNIGSGARGLAILGPVGTCDAAGLATVGGTCAANSLGALVNAGNIEVTGTATPATKGNNPESGSAMVLANSIFGGFLNEGPQTANANIATALIGGNGISLSTGSAPVLLIDPGQSITSTQGSVRGPVIIGPVQLAIDPADGFNGQNGGYSIINHGTISARPIDTDVSSIAVVIQGSSPTNYTCLGAPAASVAAGACVTSVGGNTVGGILNSGSISAQAVTAENTTSSVSAIAMSIGAYATVPRIVVTGELSTGTTSTPGSIAAVVAGPGGGSAAGIIIGNLATVPEIDVLARGNITASVQTTTISPTSDFASRVSPFSETTAAIVDQSGTLVRVNNAGSIAALNTVLTPGTGAVVSTSSHAIDLLANTSGGIVINNSGSIQGDVYFGSAGGNDTLNVGNTGASGAPNAVTGVTNTSFAYASVSSRIDGTSASGAPVTESNIINFGSGANQTLHIGGFGLVDSVILAQAGNLDVTVDPNGQLFVANTTSTGSLNARNFTINGGVLGLNITQGTSGSTPVVQATNATLSANARIGLQFGGFISSGTTAASLANPAPQVITLISANTLNVAPGTLVTDNQALDNVIPFLFESPASVEPGSSAPQPLSTGVAANGNQTLLLTLLPRSPGLKNADGTAGLGLSGDALNLFPFTAKALANDPDLGAAIATNLTVTNGAGSPTLDVVASQQKAQQVFSQFTPDVSGGTRQVAIMLTDQATGPVASRQRLLNSYGNGTGELTMWAEEFAGNINNKGRVDADGTLTDYKDHGWGFVMGMDAGSAKNGWYGGALSYYSGDVAETVPRQSLTHEQWYTLTGYSDWTGKHVFLDSTLNLSYASLDGNRGLSIGNQIRDAQGKRAGLTAAGGVTGGVNFKFGDVQVIPHLSLDGLVMREEGYAESGGGDGMDLSVAPYYANSLRAFAGSDVKDNLNIFGVTLTPEARIGYRYDVVSSPVKLKAGFVSTGGLSVPGNVVTFVGPDPDSGTALVGASLTAGTDTWSIGINYDWLRGNNGSTTQVGTLTLLGRI